MPLEENSKASNIVRLRKQYCLHAIGVFQQSSYFLENLTPSDKSSFSLIKTTKKKKTTFVFFQYVARVQKALNEHEISMKFWKKDYIQGHGLFGLLNKNNEMETFATRNQTWIF